MFETEVVTKLDAARRQLATAIELWFRDEDQVSILTLSHAAYEIIHVLSHKQGRTTPLLLDSDLIPEEHRELLKSRIKKAPNFIKHADRDSSGSIEIKPEFAEAFVLFSLLGIKSMGKSPNRYELAFLWWFYLTRPDKLTQFGRDTIAQQIPVDALDQLKRMDKGKFFQVFLEVFAVMHNSTSGSTKFTQG